METMPAVEEILMIDPPPTFCMDGITVFMP